LEQLLHHHGVWIKRLESGFWIHNPL
jgi:hypothetical protein